MLLFCNKSRLRIRESGCCALVKNHSYSDKETEWKAPTATLSSGNVTRQGQGQPGTSRQGRRRATCIKAGDPRASDVSAAAWQWRARAECLARPGCGCHPGRLFPATRQVNMRPEQTHPQARTLSQEETGGKAPRKRGGRARTRTFRAQKTGPGREEGAAKREARETQGRKPPAQGDLRPEGSWGGVSAERAEPQGTWAADTDDAECVWNVENKTNRQSHWELQEKHGHSKSHISKAHGVARP